MKQNELRPSPNYIEQLSLGLDIPDDDRSEKGYISPTEAALRSIIARAALGTEQIPEWFEDYKTLLELGWPWRVACYIAWASSPKIGRWPKTIGDLATEVLGLASARKVFDWRKKNPSIDEMVGIFQAAPMMAYRADAFRALGESAANPDHRHNPDRQLMFKMTGDFVDRQKLEMSGSAETLSDFSDEELSRMENQLRRQTSSEDEDGEDDQA